MKNHNLFLLLFLLLYVGSPATVMAQEQEEDEAGIQQLIQEFPFTATVYLQEPREVQATLSIFRTEYDIQVGRSFNLELEYGITDWIQVSVGLENNLLKGTVRDYTFRSLEIGSMVRLFSSDLQAATFAMETELPLNKPEIEEAGIEEAEVAYTPMLVYARQFGQTQLHMSGGTELQGNEKNWFYNASAVYGTGRWHPLVELTGTYLEEADWYVGAGVVLNHLNGWEVIAGVRRSLNRPDWDASVRILYEFSLGND